MLERSNKHIHFLVFYHLASPYLLDYLPRLSSLYIFLAFIGLLELLIHFDISLGWEIDE